MCVYKLRTNVVYFRISVPMFKMLDLLLANNTFSCYADDPR